jgi:hypothetical protein
MRRDEEPVFQWDPGQNTFSQQVATIGFCRLHRDTQVLEVGTITCEFATARSQDR